RRVAEEDSLHPAGDDDPFPGHRELLLVVLGGDTHAGAAEHLARLHRRRLHRDAAEVRAVRVGDRVVRRRGDQDAVPLADLLPVAGHGHRAPTADHDVDLLGLFMGVERLIGLAGDLQPGHGHVPRPELSGVHENVIAEPVPLLRGGLREPPDQHGVFLPDHPFTTRFTRRPGTTISFTTSLPSRWRCTFSLPLAASSNRSSEASLSTTTRSRSFPFTWTTSW